MAQQTNLADLRQNGAVSKPPQDPVVGALMKSFGQMKSVLPAHITPERMARIALNELRLNASLMAAAKKNPASLVNAVVQASSLGLEVGGTLGHAYLVPYGSEVKLMPGYRGLIELARRSGQIVSIAAHLVHENDLFEFEYGFEEKLRHVPARSNRGEMVGVYAYANLKDGGRVVEVLWKEDVERIRASSKTGNVWKEHYGEMARKTAVRRLFKYLPISIQLQTAIASDERAEAGLPQTDDLPPLDGNFSVIDDSAAAIDTDTGEITPPAEPSTASSNVPGLDDALAAVKSGDIDLAQDIARSLNEHDRAIVDRAIENKQSGGRAQRGQSASMNLE